METLYLQETWGWNWCDLRSNFKEIRNCIWFVFCLLSFYLLWFGKWSGGGRSNLRLNHLNWCWKSAESVWILLINSKKFRSESMLNWCWNHAELEWNYCLNFVSDPFFLPWLIFLNQFRRIQTTAKVVISATFQTVSDGTFLSGISHLEANQSSCLFASSWISRHGGHLSGNPIFAFAWHQQKWSWERECSGGVWVRERGRRRLKILINSSLRS